MGKARKALQVGVFTFAALAAVILAKPAHAQVVSKPPTDLSYYVYPGDTGSRAQGLGCSQAKFDNWRNHASFVIMDFGAQKPNGKGTYLPSSTVFWTNSADENYALHFAYGYEECGPRHVLILAIGTNNDGAVTNGALGGTWGSLVRIVAQRSSARGYSHVAVQGAVDAEPGFGPFQHFKGWEWGDKSGRGYTGRTTALLDDYGSADGCSQSLGRIANLRCGNGWNIPDEYNAVWGWPPNEGTPEIYFDGCRGRANQVNQWANVSAYGRRYQYKGMVKFVGPLDQGACLSAKAAWREFRAALARNSVPQAMRFSSQMGTR